jgi:parallel beta-helix repeat protein
MFDESATINDQIRTANDGIVTLEPRVYGIGAPLDGSLSNVTFRGVRGATRLVKLPLASNDGITAAGYHYQGWTFDGIEFDGNGREILRAGVGYYYSVPIFGTRAVRFDRCTFRDLLRGVILRDSENIAFTDCDFLGSRPDVFAAGTWDPPAVANARLGEGIEVWPQVCNLSVSCCRFRYCSSGFSVTVAAGQFGHNFSIADCQFMADWWDTPGATLRFKATRVDGLQLTCDSGGLAAVFGHNEVVTFQRQLAAGTAFKRIYAGNVGVDGDGFKDAVPGDVIETGDGKRARIGAVESTGLVNVEGWESMDCYEACLPPIDATIWRLVRYYGAGTTLVSDTDINLYADPVNPFTGERAISDAHLDLTKLPARALAKTNYSGLHVNAGISGLRVRDNNFRGSWADQCSLFDLPKGAQILGNRFSYGQDEGLTLTRSPNAVVAGNIFENSGASAIFIGGSDRSTISGNTITNWGLVNPYAGGIDGAACDMLVTGNTFTRSPDTIKDWCRAAVNLYADSTGTIIAGNSDRVSTVATLAVTAAAVPTMAALTAHDIANDRIIGDGACNVTTGIPTPSPPPLPPPPLIRVEAQATIASNSTMVIVEHGLGGQPAPESVAIVMWGAARVWLAGLSGQTLTFRTDRRAPTAGITFTWMASRQP